MQHEISSWFRQQEQHMFMSSISADQANNTNNNSFVDDFAFLEAEYNAVDGLSLDFSELIADSSYNPHPLVISNVDDDGGGVEGMLDVEGDDRDHEQDNNGESGSSGTMTVAAGERRKRDRTRTLVSERRRRGRMKEKLYELRALVPNITKMDKASIIADAVAYIQDLQKQCTELKKEIGALESSSSKEELGFQGALMSTNASCTQAEQIANVMNRGKILNVMAHEVGERRYYVKIECNANNNANGGVAASLYSAIESLANFGLESSDFLVTLDTFVLSLTLNVRELLEEMNVSAMKLWIMSALIKQGFELATTTMIE